MYAKLLAVDSDPLELEEGCFPASGTLRTQDSSKCENLNGLRPASNDSKRGRELKASSGSLAQLLRKLPGRRLHLRLWPVNPARS